MAAAATDKIVDHLTKALETAFPGIEVYLSRPKANPDEVYFAVSPRIAGIVAWSEFDGVQQIDRQGQLWSVIESALPEDDREGVGMILTLTPQEMAEARSEHK